MIKLPNYSIMLYEFEEMFERSKYHEIQRFYNTLLIKYRTQNDIELIFNWFKNISQQRLDKIKLHYQTANPDTYENVSIIAESADMTRRDNAIFIVRPERSEHKFWIIDLGPEVRI